VQNELTVEIMGSGEPLPRISNLTRHIVEEDMSVVADGKRIMFLGPATKFISSTNDPAAFANYQLAECYGSSGMKDYESALKYLSKAISLNPDVPMFYGARGLIYAGTGKADKAAADMEAQASAIRKLVELNARATGR
jgi:tetratricopeptide (TPR) repeat protein